jgi:ABC-type glutathione transport system ATPase component
VRIVKQGLLRELGVSKPSITYDTAVAGYIADSVAVMRNGAIVGRGACADVLARPVDDYACAAGDGAADVGATRG